MKVHAKNEQEFYEMSGVYEPIMRELDTVIRDVAPNLEPVFMATPTMTMMGYGLTPYKYANGKEAEWPLIAIAPQKNYASLYVCAVTDGEYYAEKYKDELGKVSCGKSCIRFKKPQDINIETVKKIIREVAKRTESGEKLFGM